MPPVRRLSRRPPPPPPGAVEADRRPPPPPAPEPEGPLTPAWLRASSEWAARSLIVAFAVVALVYALGYLRIIVLPVIIAVLLTTLLLPPKRRLMRLGVNEGLAAGLAMLGALLVVIAVIAAIAPSVGNQASELGDGLRDGVREASQVLAREPFNISRAELDDHVDKALDTLRDNSDTVTSGVTSGAIVLGEIFTALVVTALLTFFFLKDGRRLWDWLAGIIAPRARDEVDELGGRVFTALAGYVRGIALVGLVDALLIGLALVIVGVPLVLPLMILTFLAAFVPLVGAFLAGLAAVLIALVSNGLGAALIILGAIVLVQQVEGHLLYPLLMSRTVNLHPVAIIIALATGGIVAGIIGVFLAVPVAGVISTVVAHIRNRPHPDPPLAPEEAEAAPAS